MSPHMAKRRKFSVQESRLSIEDNDGDGTSREPNDNDKSDEMELQGSPNASGNLAQKALKTSNHGRRRPMLASGGSLSQGSYKSGLYNLQVDELLADVRLQDDRQLKHVETVLRELKTIIEDTPDEEELPIADAEKRLRDSYNVAVPFPEPRPSKSALYKLRYARPTSVNIIGSYALGTAINEHGSVSIDMAVTMPASIFHEKDYLNRRYFHKRAYYLACIAAGVQKHDVSKYHINFHFLNGNTLQPILCLVPSKNGELVKSRNFQYVIRVVPIVSDVIFPQAKTLPISNCVRSLEDTANGAAQAHTPTPFYNASLRSDCVANEYLKLLHDASVKCEGFKDACILGRIWLRQRGFGGSVDKGGLGHFEWAVLMALLLQSGGIDGHSLLSSGYSSYQLFKAMLQFIASRDLITSPLFIGIVDQKMTKGDVPIVFDGDRSLNVVFKMTQWSYKLLRLEASTSLKMLNDARFDYFEALLITKLDKPLDRFDLIARLPVLPLLSGSLDHETEFMLLCRKAYKVLSKGLGDRVQIISFFQQSAASWSISSSRPHASASSEVEIRFVLDPVNSGRVVDHGPSAENKTEATEFRRFWGEKAELRRFKDGRILETIVWKSGSSDRSVLQQIVIYLLEQHVSPRIGKSIRFVGDIFSDMLPKGIRGGSQVLALFRPVTAAYGDLEKVIRALEGLPLQIRHIAAASAALRYASPQSVTNSHGRINFIPADVVVQFEGSGRWPDDLVAIQRTKIALLLKMSELLAEAGQGFTSRLGLENEKHYILNSAFLDIIDSHKLAFRLRIQNEREQTLLERRLADKSLDPRSRDETVLALAEYKRIFIQAPLHTQAVQSLCTRFLLLSPTILLVKRWFNSHLLSPHFSEELIELLVVRTFVQPHPWQPPSSVMTGFLRTLSWLSKWDWRIDPLIVDINGELNFKDIETINIRFEAWRKIDPGMNRMILFAASHLDLNGVTWTEAGPSKVVAARMTTLTRSASAVVREASLDLDPAILFMSSTTDYGFVIHLHPRFTAGRRGQKAKNQEYKNLPAQSSEDLSLIGYDPVQLFIDELKSLYSSNILFFYNSEECTIIAGLWNPHTGPRPWKVNLTYSTKPIINIEDRGSSGEEQPARLDINKTAMLHEISRLGGDMISHIDINR